ncbi:alpha-glucuronidase family glycosyl hydrolase [Runella zeae]|uniref:alpha-glucuronidase family glycosyl hydrolase n=1 Tax=Runella zeae TaxID=94255 RepID=UPI00041E2EC4|nr:alpha-glucuronidase family glycosyl hydrolase [Runella zeae]
MTKLYLAVCFLFICSLSSYANKLDLSSAQIFCPIRNKEITKRSIEILQQEVKKRSYLDLSVTSTLPSHEHACIGIALESDLSAFPEIYKAAIRQLPTISAEGFKLVVIKDKKTVLIVGKDARGVLYGVGRLLRKLEMTPQQLMLPTDVSIATSPRYSIRGHQLGYRPKTNAYDAFTVAQFDQYIRELALFGANSIEIVPPRTDDDPTSRHMVMPSLQMITEQARICKEYGLDVWMWYPNMGLNYTHPDSIQKELQERHEVFGAVSRLDHVFVPGGDPGELEPDVLFAWLTKVATVLHKYHPKAKIWVSPQVFRPTQKWFDAFFAHVNKSYPWFGGVVFGPWVKIPVHEIRRLAKPSIPIRHYPDITHNYTAQYPIPYWDLAYSMTLGRESINPRPHDEKIIHNALDQYGNGSISYSEGTNDDVNKFVWSDQDWNPDTPVIETLRDYARLFFGPNYQESIAQGIVALENNLKGPLVTNEGIYRTLTQWQTIEKSAPLSLLQNPRFQMGQIRAYYDAYTRRRLLYENELEQQARDALRMASATNISASLQEAKSTLQKAWTSPIWPNYRQKCFDLADSLFKSIGAQLTVEKHGAVSGRGNFIDNIDIPLNDSPWLLDQIAQLEKLKSPSEQLQKIQEILHRTDPGAGGFYDHFGSPESWHRVVSDVSWEKDPGSLLSPRVSFGVGLAGEEWVDEIKATGFKGQVTPRVWMKQVKTLYNLPLKIAYDELDPRAAYKIKISYTGRFQSRMKLTTDDGSVVHDFLQTGEQPIFEFEVPQKATADGKVTFVWNCGEGERGSQVTEIWLMKK